MLERLVTLCVAAAALTLHVPGASADHVSTFCELRAAEYSLVTGEYTWEGIAYGYVSGHLGEQVSARCVVRVNGGIRAATAWNTGTTLVTMSDRVTYVRMASEVVQVCAQYTTSHGYTETCFATTTMQVPPQEVIDAISLAGDLVRQAGKDYADPLVCPVLQSLNGSYGIIEIRPGSGGTGGDVYVDGTRVYDCPFYERARL